MTAIQQDIPFLIPPDKIVCTQHIGNTRPSMSVNRNTVAGGNMRMNHAHTIVL